MKTITINDPIVFVKDNRYDISINGKNKITVIHESTDITADVIGKSPEIDAFIEAVVESIAMCDKLVEDNKKLIAESWKEIDRLKNEYDNLKNK